jgi:hypothetical protein
MKMKVFRDIGMQFSGTPSPAGAECIVAFHLPFDSGLELWREADIPPIVGRADREFRSSKTGVAVIGLHQLMADDADLFLQQYSAEEGARLLRRLPHRIWEESLMGAARENPQIARPFSLQEIAWNLMDARTSIWSGGAGLLTIEYALDIPRRFNWTEVSQFIDSAHFRN